MSDQPISVLRIPIRLRHHIDRSRPPQQRGEEIACEAIVDFDAGGLALPANLVARLRLRQLDTVRVYTLDEGEYQYRVCGIVELDVQGRTYHVKVSELPGGAEPILGAAMLQRVDWHVSLQDNRPVPNPESPGNS